MLNGFLTYINAESLFLAHNKLLIAVSGGKDSMVLLDLLRRGGFDFGVAHVNFKLRDAASDGDELFVETYCKTHDLPFFTAAFDTKNHAKTNGISTQMAARELRYAWFEEIRLKSHYDFIVTAHHRNDNLETVLLNFTRGTGIVGLTGISAKRDFLVRPLLLFSREEIDAYAEENNILWREDASNTCTDYRRNRIRHNVIPELKTINPNLDNGFERTLERLKAAEFAWNLLVNDIKKLVWYEVENAIRIDAQTLKIHPFALTLLESLLLPFGFFRQQLADALTATVSSSFITKSHTLFVGRTDWFLVENALLQSVEISIDDISTSVEVAGKTFSFELLDKLPPAEELRKAAVAFLDHEKLQFPLTLRTWQSGDRFQPFGMKGNKLVSDYLIDIKLPLPEKQRQLVLTDQKHIIWVIGKRISQLYAVDETTEKILKVKFVNSSTRPSINSG